MTFPTIETVKMFYSWNLDIKTYVALKVITEAEFKTITGTTYKA